MKLFKNSNKNIDARELVAKGIWLWDKSFRVVFAVFFIALVGLGAYVWYESIYSGEWSADKKQQYLDSQEKSVTLKQQEFTKALNDITQRQTAFNAPYVPIKDIFVPYAGAPTGSGQ